LRYWCMQRFYWWHRLLRRIVSYLSTNCYHQIKLRTTESTLSFLLNEKIQAINQASQRQKTTPSFAVHGVFIICQNQKY